MQRTVLRHKSPRIRGINHTLDIILKVIRRFNMQVTAGHRCRKTILTRKQPVRLVTLHMLPESVSAGYIFCEEINTDCHLFLCRQIGIPHLTEVIDKRL